MAPGIPVVYAGSELGMVCVDSPMPITIGFYISTAMGDGHVAVSVHSRWLPAWLTCSQVGQRDPLWNIKATHEGRRYDTTSELYVWLKMLNTWVGSSSAVAMTSIRVLI
jgi:hypothetical protein